MRPLRAIPIPVRIGAALAAVILLGAIGVLAMLGQARPPAVASATETPTPSPSSSATQSPSPSPSPSDSPPAVTARCPLNGVPVSTAPPANRTALIVQIENHPLARPTRNLTNADIVIEATVEGDVTRFSAVFYCQPTVGLTGPIRSARYYNIDLWQEMHGLTVAFGASSGARKRFAAAGMPQINGILGGWPFFHRFGTSPAPHNLYGDIEAVRLAVTGSGAAAVEARAAGTLHRPFTISPDPVLPAGTQVHEIAIRTNSYWVFGWRWDAGLGQWRRIDAGQEDVDAATGKPITAASVVVQRITESVVYGDPDPGGNPRRDLHLVGSGAGTLYVGGRAIPVRWSRPSASAVTTWTYPDGKPMVLPPGPIWWELVPAYASVISS